MNRFANCNAAAFTPRLSIVGDGTGADELRDFIRLHDLSGSVTLHGALSHPATRALLGTADLFVLPSFAEGVPVALMEAMSMEIACISTYVAGIPELIEAGEQGLLAYRPRPSQALTEAMASLLTNHGLRRLIASAGRRKILSNYDLANNIRHLAGVFQQHGLAAAKSHETLMSPPIQSPN